MLEVLDIHCYDTIKPISEVSFSMEKSINNEDSKAEEI